MHVVECLLYDAAFKFHVCVSIIIDYIVSNSAIFGIAYCWYYIYSVTYDDKLLLYDTTTLLLYVNNTLLFIDILSA